MKKNNIEVLNKKRELEKLLNGELEKAVWSTIWRYEPITAPEVVQKLVRNHDKVSAVIEKLISFRMVQVQARGLYVVSSFILDGEKC